ncbi:MAG: sigma 54-interacting transcriptional regulator, partial [Spirochaetota bacterium]
SQVKLLRLLQSAEYYSLGSDLCQRTDVRVIVATNRNLEDAVASGAFRKDLYYRLYTHQILIPPLRKRKGDIPILFDHFIKKASAEMGKEHLSYDPRIIPLLCCYDFPGNVRELESIVCDAVASTRENMLIPELFLRRLPSEIAEMPVTQNTAESIIEIKGGQFPTIREMEKLLIVKAMKLSGNIQSRAAALLGISRQTLNAKLKDMD